MVRKPVAAFVPVGALAIALAVFLLCAPALAQEDAAEPASPPTLEKIADNVWAHKSYAFLKPWGNVMSQGMVVKTENGVILIDTAWNDKDTNHLLDLIEETVGAAPRAAVVTHAHDDKMGGVGALNAHGIPVVMHYWTMLDAPARGLALSTVPQSRVIFRNETDARQPVRLALAADTDEQVLALTPFEEPADDGASVVIHYPGPGHTRDNIVVYYEPANVLFGGCLIRHAITNSLGNTAHGDVGQWARTTRNAAQTFPEAKIVVPSHGPMAGAKLLGHTIAIADKAAQKTKASRE